MAVLISSLLFTSCILSKNKGIKVGDKVPEFQLESSVYGTIGNADMADKVTMLCFIATWCPSCQSELDAIQNTFLPEFEHNENVLMIVAGREHTDTELTEYKNEYGLTFPIYPDPHRNVYSKFAEETIPRVYIIDKNGIVAFASTGYSDEKFTLMTDKIKELCGL